MDKLQALLDHFTAVSALPLNSWRAAETKAALLAIQEEHRETVDTADAPHIFIRQFSAA